MAKISVDKALIKAISYSKKNKVVEAKKLYQAVLKAFPKNIRALQGLAALSEPEKNNNTQNPPQEIVNQLVNLFNQGQTAAVIRQAEHLIKEYPETILVWNILGASRAQTGMLDEAIEAYKKSISLKPDHADAYINMGVALRKQGKFDEAIEAYKKSILLKPNDADIYNNLGGTLKDHGKLDEAIKVYSKVIIIKPDYPISYVNMGNALKDQGKLDEAIETYKKSISLKPDYAIAYNNMGVTLKDQGKFDEAIEAYKKALSVKPNYAEAYDNMGVAYKHQYKLDKAIEAFNKALLLKPYHANAYYNMANALRDQGKLEESVTACMKALSLKPNYAAAYNNLGNTLQEMGRLDDAEASYTNALALKPNFAEAMYNLSINRSYMNNLKAEISAWKNVLLIDSNDYGLRANVNLAIHNFLQGNFNESKKQVLAAKKIHEKTLSKYKTEKVYQRYLFEILKWHENKYFDVDKPKNFKTLYVLGESHSLTSHHLHIQSYGVNFLCKANLIKGCKQWHLGNSFRNKFKNQFESIFLSLPKYSDVLLAVGEIDCRIDSGILKHKNKFPEKDIREIIIVTIENYIKYIEKNNIECKHNIFIQGVPCPNINTGFNSKKNIIELIEVIKIFNYVLEAKANEKAFGFLDVHKLTDKGNGFSNNLWHIDNHHLSPDGMLEVWRRLNS